MLIDISKFSSKIAAKGLASPNKFYVKFTKCPKDALGNSTYSDLNIMCESAVLAGRNVQSLLDRQYGLNREVAYNGPTYNPITLSFLCTKDYTEKRIFDRWNNMIVDISKGYDVAYYNTYIGEMTVSALDVTGKETYSIHYKECWPKTVNGVELNHSTQNAAARVTVEMAYAYWESSDIKTNGVGTSVTPTNSADTTAGTTTE
tara:strand:- start:900 stop:1508 length:609 start_codon:yes stop_codon:yes gene_type:complete